LKPRLTERMRLPGTMRISGSQGVRIVAQADEAGGRPWGTGHGGIGARWNGGATSN
jgi:hypothetical protein